MNKKQTEKAGLLRYLRTNCRCKTTNKLIYKDANSCFCNTEIIHLHCDGCGGIRRRVWNKEIYEALLDGRLLGERAWGKDSGEKISFLSIDEEIGRFQD